METFQGIVDSLAFGGDGVVRADGLVVFVPFTAPGDRIQGQLTERKKRYARGELLELLQPSEARVQPLCPYFGTCGGCQLQHISYKAQIDAKTAMVAESFQRIGKVTELPILPTQPSPSPWAYRRHITLHLREDRGVFQVGYYALDNHSILSVQQCPIFALPDDPLFQEVYSLVTYLKPKQGETGSLRILKKEEGGYLLALQLKNWTKGWENVLKNSTFKGTAIKVGSKVEQTGATELFYTYGNLPFEFSPFAFIQNHPDQSRFIYENIVKTVDQGPVIDLYCGIGVSSLLLAQKGFEVLGIENNPQAIELAKKNSERLQLAAQFICAGAEKVFGTALKEKRPSWVVVNPPREGLDRSVIEPLCSAKVKGVIYISCMPSTIARDTEILSQAGYALKTCQPFDMFPQTGHIETVAEFRYQGSFP